MERNKDEEKRHAHMHTDQDTLTHTHTHIKGNADRGRGGNMHTKQLPSFDTIKSTTTACALLVKVVMKHS